MERQSRAGKFLNGRAAASLCCLVLTQPYLASAQPYLPVDEGQILERRSFNAADPVAREVRALRNKLVKDPDNLGLAAQLATRYIEAGRSEGDPRLFGRAQALLSPWWDLTTAPARVLLLKAIIRQNAHEFDSALADLDAVLLMESANAQAWLVKASILQVQGRYDGARHACQSLTRLAARHIALICASDIAGLTGQAARSRDTLQWVVQHSGAPDPERQWSLLVLAELTARTGQPAMAEQYFSESLRLGAKDQYLLGAYADYLLDQGRPQDVLTLLQGEPKADGLLLRLALAEQALHLPAAKDHTAILAARFAAGRDRGPRIHVREETRFTLSLLGDAQQALALAQDNWAVQKEPWDARLLLESALAVGNRHAAQPVFDWLAASGIEDPRLHELAARLSTRLPS